MRRLSLACLFLLFAAATHADERVLPVARIVIYPGDPIGEQMIEDKSMFLAPGNEALIAKTKSAVIGKVARRTLLPGEAIPLIAVDNPHVIILGAQVKIVFAESGMQIVAYGVAQQAGAVGDIVRVRNQDSGRFVSGRVQPDGSVRVSEG